MSRAPGPYAPGPYRQPGSDGRTYFKVLPGIHGLGQFWLEALKLYEDLGRINHPAVPAKRALLARVVADMETSIKAGELIVADATDAAVRERIQATQVRPDNPSGPAMLTGINSRPLPYPDLPFFAVGQVDIGLLNRAATSQGSGKPYWPSQEFGYTGNIGRVVRGAFMPGNSAPSGADFRVHPIFQAGASPNKLMRIQKPIEERAFLRSGVMQGALLRARLWGQIEKQAVRDLTRVVTLGTKPGQRRRP